jgi:multidrug efflux pump subunit AcrB
MFTVRRPRERATETEPYDGRPSPSRQFANGVKSPANQPRAGHHDGEIIMLAVPLGLGGVILILYLTRTNINIQSLMGTLMMIGVVVNNSILLVEFANRRRADGLSPRDAALSAAQVRLRPILMTSLTLVASMLPLSIQFAPGNEAMIPLARALLGGMIVSTVLTLVLVPCVYARVHRGKQQPA